MLEMRTASLALPGPSGDATAIAFRQEGAPHGPAPAPPPRHGAFGPPARLARLVAPPPTLRAAWDLATMRVVVILEGRIMGEKALRIIIASLLLFLWPLAASAFHLQEATIADIQRAILAKELTTTTLVGL